MVLQRDMKVPLWGTATPGRTVNVTIGDQSVTATVDPAGKWKLEFDPMEAGGPHHVIVTGDARTNYRPPEADRFQAIADRARAVFWLNPEPERSWDTGDSMMGVYGPRCSRVEEVRSLRQLERFIERAALPIEGAPRSG